jgi:hypothetical protein
MHFSRARKNSYFLPDLADQIRHRATSWHFPKAVLSIKFPIAQWIIESHV